MNKSAKIYINGESLNAESSAKDGKKGLGIASTSFILVSQMAGAGFLALPLAFANSGWLGIPMILLFGCSIGFSGTRLGHCWVILEERWPLYKTPQRQPYMEIAYRSFGSIGRKVMLAVLLITLIGVNIVVLIITAEFVKSVLPNASMCVIVIIIGAILVPFSWLGTPEDVWPASTLATVVTVLACVIVIVQLIIDVGTPHVPKVPSYSNPTVLSLSLGFSSILFGFGGAAIFPTMQNDMADRTQFWKCVTITFTTILSLYTPVAITGYAVLGDTTPSNILLYRDELTVLLKVGIWFEIINLVATLLVGLSPVCQTLEEMLQTPRTFGLPRVALRSSLVAFYVLVGLAMPDFGYILNLVGGSTIAFCSFIAPAVMYLKLVRDKTNPNWPKRALPKWEVIWLYEIIIFGIIGAICSTYFAILEIVNADFSESCLVDFFQ